MYHINGVPQPKTNGRIIWVFDRVWRLKKIMWISWRYGAEIAEQSFLHPTMRIFSNIIQSMKLYLIL